MVPTVELKTMTCIVEHNVFCASRPDLVAKILDQRFEGIKIDVNSSFDIKAKIVKFVGNRIGIAGGVREIESILVFVIAIADDQSKPFARHLGHGEVDSYEEKNTRKQTGSPKYRIGDPV
jgi:hypothetical protein